MNVIEFLQRGAIDALDNNNEEGVIPESTSSKDSFGKLSALTLVYNDGERGQAARSQRTHHRVLKSGGGKDSVSLSVQSISQPLQVLPIPQHTCELCWSTFDDQFKFFEHLKSHYENVPSTSASSTENKKRKKRLSPKSTNGGVSRGEGPTSAGSDGSKDVPQIVGQKITTNDNTVNQFYFVQFTNSCSI